MTDETQTNDVVDTPEVETETTTQPESQATPDVLAKELERARKEAAKYRTRLREKEESEQKAAEEARQAELTAEERARELKAKLEEAERDANNRVMTAERKSQLAGQVSNPNRVLKLMENHEEYFDGVEPNIEKILEDFPEYAPQKEEPRAAPAPQGAPAPAKGVTMERLADLTPEQINAQWDTIVSNLKE
jgi:chromosome segregation ATPase